MATKRTVKTPGAPEQPEVKTEVAETTQPTTAEQADAALESITGADESVIPDALVPVEQFDAVAQELAETKAKLAALEAKATAPAKTAAPESKNAEVKRRIPVLTKYGWTTKEV
ncbi:hypothetical protein ABEF83_08130 [Acinetobacter thermotolerans]|uniref:hypothetical protein n=1 Tax=Acinetobacter thermotolerans TaxID=3151487 RepID=UPI00325BD19A